ncbi:MAG: hypothetical protein EPN19_14805 [Betaproteobacteria bacterium]|nr:MAG: hypothetical protein EPN19_14805 [Betaproteobacteria bacterium]
MTQGLRLAVMAAAVAVNGAALAVLHAAMLQTAEQERSALQRPARIVVSAPPSTLVATQSCPAPRVL